MTSKIKLSTGMLCFSRSLQIGEGMLFARNSAHPETTYPVPVYRKGVRGQSSHASPKPGKPFNPGKSNPQVIEAAVMPAETDTLDLTFSLKILPNGLVAEACDDPEVKANYKELVELYRARGGFRLLAERYAWNVANGRFAWRNRTVTPEARVTVEFEGRKLVFDPFRLDLEEPADTAELGEAVVEGGPDDVAAFVTGIQRGLESRLFISRVTWSSRMEPFEEVFPSQEYVKYPAPNDPSRICAKFPVMREGREVNQASVHSQKIGAALRTIDDWHGDARGAVPVNPYAGVQSEGVALRNRIHDKAPSFKDLQQKGLGTQLKKDIEAASEAEEMPGEAHFFVGVLLRGGVFGTNDTANESA